MVAWNDTGKDLFFRNPHNRFERPTFQAKQEKPALNPKIAHVVELLIELSVLQAKLPSESPDIIISSEKNSDQPKIEAAPPLFEQGPDFEIPLRYNWPEFDAPEEEE